MKVLFPCITAGMSFGAAMVYAAQHDWRHAVYWWCAAVMTIVVTF